MTETKEIKETKAVTKQVADGTALAAWEAKYPQRKVEEIIVRNEDGSKEVIVFALVPNAKESMDYMTQVDKDMYRASTMLINKCLLSAKEEIVADSELFMACSTALMSLVKVGSFELKKH